MLDGLCSGMSRGADGHESVFMNQCYMLNMVSLNRNTRKTRLCFFPSFIEI